MTSSAYKAYLMTDDAAAPLAAIDRPRRLTVRATQKSDVGLVRTENQDFAILSTAEEEVLAKDRGRLLVVADGMGGHQGGATASRMAGNVIKGEYLKGDFDDPSNSLRRALQRANAEIFHEAQGNPALRGMGTTCSAMVIRGDEAFIAHVGDSRIYMVRENEIRQLTQDHSLVASMVREGLLTSQEAEVHPRRNVLQRSMGVAEQVEVDVLQPIRIQPGDTFILCSDGLHGLVKAEEMREVSALPIDNAASEFVHRAIERGAPDNVTVIVARVEESTESAGEPVSDHLALATATAAGSEPTDKHPAQKPESSILRWIFIALLILGLAGAAAYVWLRSDDQPPRVTQPNSEN